MKYNYISYKNFKTVSSILYFMFLIYIFFFARRRRHDYKHELNLIPLKNMFTEFKKISEPGSLNYYSNLMGNIILFIPFPIILVISYKVSKFSTIILISFTLSFLIEFLQFIFRVGVADINDIILNTTGSCIGYFFYSIYKNAY
jgi:glycopeptide antibiotics resistance protein